MTEVKYADYSQLRPTILDFASPQTHLLMLRNRPKYRAFVAALTHVCRQRTVLDIGAGTGILSLIAARLGARKVVAVEREEVAPITRTVLRQFSHTSHDISLLVGDYRDLHFLAGDFDIIMSETIGYFGFDEGIGELARVARAHLLPGGVFLPIAIDLTIHPISRPEQAGSGASFHAELPRLPVRQFTTRPYHVLFPEACTWTHTWRTEWEAGAAGTVEALGVSVEVGLGTDVSFSTGLMPGWPKCALPLETSATFTPGDRIDIRLTAKDSASGFKVSASCFISGIPRRTGVYTVGDMNRPCLPESSSDADLLAAVDGILAEMDV